MTIELVEKEEQAKGGEKRKRERATPDLPKEVTEAINAMCDADPFIKKAKVVATVRAAYGSFIKMRRDQAESEFVKNVASPAGIKKLISGGAVA